MVVQSHTVLYRKLGEADLDTDMIVSGRKYCLDAWLETRPRKGLECQTRRACCACLASVKRHSFPLLQRTGPEGESACQQHISPDGGYVVGCDRAEKASVMHEDLASQSFVPL